MGILKMIAGKKHAYRDPCAAGFQKASNRNSKMFMARAGAKQSEVPSQGFLDFWETPSGG